MQPDKETIELEMWLNSLELEFSTDQPEEIKPGLWLWEAKKCDEKYCGQGGTPLECKKSLGEDYKNKNEKRKSREVLDFLSGIL